MDGTRRFANHPRIEEELSQFLRERNAQIIQLFRMDEESFLLAYRVEDTRQKNIAPSVQNPGEMPPENLKLGWKEGRAIAEELQRNIDSSVKVPGKDAVNVDGIEQEIAEATQRKIDSSVKVPEPDAVKEAPKAPDLIPLVPAKSRDGKKALCQAGVFGVPPGTPLVPGDPPVPPPLISGSCDLSEWADLFSNVKRKELPDGGSKTGVPLRASAGPGERG